LLERFIEKPNQMFCWKQKESPQGSTPNSCLSSTDTAVNTPRENK
jgi:hypothetical protein